MKLSNATPTPTAASPSPASTKLCAGWVLPTRPHSNTLGVVHAFRDVDGNRRSLCGVDLTGFGGLMDDPAEEVGCERCRKALDLTR